MEHNHIDFTVDIESHSLEQLFGFTVQIKNDAKSFAKSMLGQIESNYVGEIRALPKKTTSI